MAKSRGLDGKLDRLRVLRRETPEDGHVAELRRALSDTSNLVVEAAADIVGERAMVELSADLVAAFDRFMIDPIDTDPRCRAKIAIVESLNKTDYQREDVFLRGVSHFQEAGRPGEDDPAALLRGNAALGLARILYPGAVLLFTDLLFDKAKAVRVAAAQALGDTRSPAAIPLLRFKAQLGDKESEVTGACLSALMATTPAESVAFVARFLRNRDEAIQADAALALGESRRSDALDALIGYWPKILGESLAEVLLLAIAVTRLPAAHDFLLEILSTGKAPEVTAALSALTIHRHNDAIKDRIAATLNTRGDASLIERFKKKFAEKE